MVHHCLEGECEESPDACGGHLISEDGSEHVCPLLGLPSVASQAVHHRAHQQIRVRIQWISATATTSTTTTSSSSSCCIMMIITTATAADAADTAHHHHHIDAITVYIGIEIGNNIMECSSAQIVIAATVVGVVVVSNDGIAVTANTAITVAIAIAIAVAVAVAVVVMVMMVDWCQLRGWRWQRYCSRCHHIACVFQQNRCLFFFFHSFGFGARCIFFFSSRNSLFGNNV